MHRIEMLEKFIMVPLFLTGMCVSFFGVIMRYIFNSPVHWVEEIFSLTLVWAIFIGFSTALKNNNHIALDLVYAVLPKKAQRVLDFIGYLLGIAFSIFFLYYGTLMVIEAFKIGGVSLDARIPLWITSLIMPLTGLLLLLAYIEKIIMFFKNKGQEEEQNDGILAG
ncbi:TRAP transporter small permease [Oceanobacillus alkalisoli]|uniref:TRAP transporter small permease n=1 Tax=Oceanobacillus alkalisoli TaxID=2925113 RepID=UPI001F119E4C|nr:TRAP transporter small permease [Oceanobacillus alkalisoli]MCF3942612.1 TRAP transporter small permease [Oceanobacillus alkalisoli]